MDTENSALESLLAESHKLQEESYPTVPRSISVVKDVTLFCRYKDPKVQQLAGTDDEIETLKAIREAKDNKTSLGRL